MWLGLVALVCVFWWWFALVCASAVVACFLFGWFGLRGLLERGCVYLAGILAGYLVVVLFCPDLDLFLCDDVLDIWWCFAVGLC